MPWVLVMGAVACGDPSQRLSEQRAHVEIAELEVRAEFGVLEESDPMAVLRRPLDAAFSTNHVFVLDASPPWVRVYDRAGSFVRAAVRRGEGPGEALRPLSLTAAADGGVVLTHTRGVMRLGSDGELMGSTATGANMIRGAVEGCGGEVFALTLSLGDKNELGSIIKLGTAGRLGTSQVWETLVALGSLRRRDPHRTLTPFLERTARGILIYTEEVNRDRVLEVACDGRVIRDIEVPPLGEPARIVPADAPGRIGIRWALPPYQGGLVQLDNRVLWAGLAVDSASSGGSIDSTTIVTAFDPVGTSRSIIINGWFQLLDSDSTGSVLLGNADGLHPSVIMIEGAKLLRLIEQRGTSGS